MPVETNNTSSSGLDTSSSSDSSIHNASIPSPVVPAGPSPVHQDVALPQGLNGFQSSMGMPQPTPQIVPHLFPQDQPLTIPQDLQLLPVHMPQHPIQLQHIQQPVQPHLLTGINIRHEPLDFSKESLQQMQGQPLLTSPLVVKPARPKADRRRGVNPSVGEQRDSNSEVRDSNAETRDLVR